MKMTKEELCAEGAFILEQEGWLINSAVHSKFGASTSRIYKFSERYTEWQRKVREFREQHPGEWEEPPDNS